MKQQQIQQIKFILSSLSQLGNRIMITQLGTALRMLGYNPSHADIKKCQDYVDATKRGSFKVQKFLKLIESGVIKKDVQPTIILNGALQTFDQEGKGLIDIQVLQDALTKTADKFTNDQYRAFLEYADPSHSGKVRIKDFTALITSDINYI